MLGSTISGCDDLGLVDPAPLARVQHGHEEALGAAGGHVAGCVAVAAHQPADHGHDLGLEPAQAGKGRGVEAVLGEEGRVGRLGQLVDLVAGVEDQAEHLALPPLHVVAAGGLHLGQDGGAGKTVVGELDALVGHGARLRCRW